MPEGSGRRGPGGNGRHGKWVGWAGTQHGSRESSGKHGNRAQVRDDGGLAKAVAGGPKEVDRQRHSALSVKGTGFTFFFKIFYFRERGNMTRGRGRGKEGLSSRLCTERRV